MRNPIPVPSGVTDDRIPQAQLESVIQQLVAFGGPFAADWKVRSLSGAGARAVYPALASTLAKKRVTNKGKGKTPAQATQRRQFTLEALADGDETS